MPRLFLLLLCTTTPLFTQGPAGRAILLADKVKAELFEIRNLAVGMVAPNIKGEDIDGVKFSLSDYRGKVVLLDFWGDW